MEVESYVEKAKFKRRHEAFQFGQNPMKKSPFEKSRVLLEQEERKLAREKYIKGIQGRDGGCFDGEIEGHVPFGAERTY